MNFDSASRLYLTGVLILCLSASRSPLQRKGSTRIRPSRRRPTRSVVSTFPFVYRRLSFSQKAKKKGSGFVDLLTRVFLLWFTIYTLSVCPTDEKLQSPLCRGLQYYRQLVLDPFVLPPIKFALSHPSIAPYVERATPYANQFVSTATPIAIRARTEWNARIVPQWNKRVVPLWNAHVVPQWDKYGAPQVTRIEKQLEPYRLKAVHEYERRLGPHLRLAVYNLQKWQRQAQPYIILAANKTYDGYQKSKPYTIPVLQRLKGLFARLARFLAAQRRQYVDPHVKIIWDRVIELSSGKSRPETGTSPAATHAASFVSSSSSIGQGTPLCSILQTDSDTIVASPPSITPVVVSESDSFQESTFATSPTSTASGKSQRGEQNDEAEDITPLLAKDTAPAGTIAASPTQSAIPSVSQASDHASSFVPGEDHVESSEPVNSGSDIPFDSSASTAIPHSAQFSTSIKDTVLEESGVYSSLTPDGPGSAPLTRLGSDRNVVPESTPTSVPQKIDTPPAEDGDVDLDQFWAELGLGDDMLNDSSETLDAEIPEPTESEEEKAERLRLRLEETARKRADITTRHSQWEAQLEERFEENLKLLRRALVSIRKGAVAELKDSVEIRKEVETLVEEAEKYLKGAEKYLGNLRRESRTVDDKRAMWDRVVDRVDSKFGERLSQTEALVNGWFNQVLNKEIEEVCFFFTPGQIECYSDRRTNFKVRKLSEQVKDIADRGQADMGLDYAWLDDVTYNDWQRYHALVHRKYSVSLIDEGLFILLM